MAWFAGRWSLRGTGTPFSRPVNLAQHILVFVLRMYRRLVSPLLTSAFGPMGLGCRFTPTCSEYALEALTVHGALKGSWLATCRLGRCHPWGGCGFDPVPPIGLPGSVSRMSRGRKADRGGRRNPTPAGGAPGSVLRSFAPACCREETAQKTPRLVTRSNGS